MNENRYGTILSPVLDEATLNNPKSATGQDNENKEDFNCIKRNSKCSKRHDTNKHRSAFRKSFEKSMETFWRMVNADAKAPSSRFIRRRQLTIDTTIQIGDTLANDLVNDDTGSPITDFFTFFDASYHISNPVTNSLPVGIGVGSCVNKMTNNAGRNGDPLQELQIDSDREGPGNNQSITTTETSNDIVLENRKTRLHWRGLLCLWFTSWMRWVERTRVGKMLFRFLPIIISLWTLTDIAFDAIQAKEYRDYSITGIENCTYNESTVYGTNGENQAKISPLYFWISFTTFVLPPFIGVLIFYAVHGRYGVFGDPSKPHLIKYKDKIAASPFLIRVGLIGVFIPILTIVRAFIGYYFFLPFCTLFFSAKQMIKGKLKPTERIDIVGMDMYFTPAVLPFFTLTEQLGEAGPQMLLATVFLFNNHDCKGLYTYDLFGTFMPQSVISLFFSFGSFLVGTIKGIITGYQFLRQFREENAA